MLVARSLVVTDEKYKYGNKRGSKYTGYFSRSLIPVAGGDRLKYHRPR